MPKDWGKICVASRLEKHTESQFVMEWSALITQGLRRGDAFLLERDMMAHWAMNKLVRRFLKSDADSFCNIDSDASFGPGILNELRDYQAGWDYDILQVFCTRRGWPPEAIWFKKNVLGDLVQCLVWDEDCIEDVEAVTTHFCIIRRSVFEGMAKAHPEVKPEHFDWFYYPRNTGGGEDTAFSREAKELGFRVGATTHIKVGHIGRVVTGWETYQEVLELGGQKDRMRTYTDLVKRVAALTSESTEIVAAKAMRGNQNTKDPWNAAAPKTSDEVRDFYGQKDNGYLYDLIAWNSSPFYGQITKPLKDMRGNRVLVVGAGLGSEIQLLADNNRVDAFELPGILKDFCKDRFNGLVHFLDGNTLMEAKPGQYDVVVAVDVIEHIHPDEFDATMEAVANAILPQGILFARVNFTQTDPDLFPMHFDHGKRFDAWLKKNRMVQTGESMWLKK